MTGYLIRRFLLLIPTLFGIMVINFLLLQILPGGPVERMLAAIQGYSDQNYQGLAGQESDFIDSSIYHSHDPELVARLRNEFGLDRPLWQQFSSMIYRYVTFDYGESFFLGRSVIDLIAEKLPVSISLGVWSTLLIYLVSIPLGIAKAVRDGSRFDAWSSTIIIFANAIPAFIFAILLIILFAGGRFWQIFPISGIVSDNFSDLPWYQQIIDYFWHLCLPIIAITIGGFATITLLTKNSFLEHMYQQYVITARAKGASERRVLYGHVFRNAMLIIIAALPGLLIATLFTSSLLIEILFSLDGLGLLGYQAVLARDYPIILASLFIFSLLGLVISIISDFTYSLIDPRIEFSSHRN